MSCLPRRQKCTSNAQYYVLNFNTGNLQNISDWCKLELLIVVLIIVAIKRQQPVTAGDISRQREVKRRGSFFTFLLALIPPPENISIIPFSHSLIHSLFPPPENISIIPFTHPLILSFTHYICCTKQKHEKENCIGNRRIEQ